MIHSRPAENGYLQIYLDSWIIPNSDHFFFFKSLFRELFWVRYLNQRNVEVGFIDSSTNVAPPQTFIFF